MSIENPLLDVRGLDVQFRGRRGAHHAVKRLDFALAEGEALALVGESGCGKSTTALSILRLLGANARIGGEIRLQGRDILGLSLAALRRLRGRDVSMIFQEPMTSLNPVHTVGAQIGETLRLHQDLSRQAARRRTLEMLDLVKIPEPQRRIDDYPHNLSGGQRQRVMIAMAVACQPRLLIADEPTTALDVTVQARILQLLDQLRRDLSMGLLLITHDLGVVSQWADRVLVMFDGEKVEEGLTRQVFEHPRHAYVQGLLGASLHAGRQAHYRHGALPEIHRVVDRESGMRSFRLATPQLRFDETAPRGQGGAPALLSVQALRTSYARRDGSLFHAVDGVSFEIGRGETLGLVGESGCGKSTLSRTLMRLVPAASGRIVLDGVDLASLTQREVKPWRKRIQMVFQDPYASLNPRRNVFDTLDAVLALHGEKDRARRRALIGQTLERVGLPAAAANRFPHEFSGGQRQRIGIARALILRPSLVILDEPVSALDVSIQAQILNLLAELKRDFGLSYLFISHDLAVVRYIADRVLVMNEGRIVEEGDHEQIWRSPRHPYTQSLIAAVPRPLPEVAVAVA
ncbi:glutathione ABC transporter ATP-binding protein GsiA [Bordetella genomosp. 10]|uniref:Glutathione ABC transporter ATP-binding protein GsiA n=1 Tax=Bordetella genomosp. 10 TaxID=1416804 RepID=A0A261SND4_9BORD|nr:ABC transporter ATP-binding protein [Bordetella genomosp. 10]OZI37833.1 glutathione ABC transporter ATP-binding protein GsiA [Bordetella genomosp. 10]